MKNEKADFVVYGIHYFIYPPEECEDCAHWKSGKRKCCKRGRVCPYLLREIDNLNTCARCAYSRIGSCASGACYRDLVAEMNRKRVERS